MQPMPAPARAVPVRPSFDELERAANQRVVAEMIRHRTRLAPVILTFVVIVVLADPSPWRIGLVSLAMAVLFTGVLLERRIGLARMSLRHLVGVAIVTAVAQMIVIFALGGLAGPVVPAMPLVAVIMSLVAPGWMPRLFVFGIQIPAVWCFAWFQASGVVPELVPDEWSGLFAPPGTPGPGPWFGAFFLTVMLIGASVIGRALREVLLSLVREQIDDRDRELALHEESVRTLGQLSAEIAHELKNPLASVKGLAALVRKDLTGTPAERMDVLRREVDRLQGILEEFLSYSRPLVPIDEERVDLVALAREVVELHEGVARQREVVLEAPSGEAHLRCDPRKIKRVLINLVQNAIEASASGGTVVVEVERGHEGAEVRVLDRGSGLGPGAAEKLFTVGFTTKDEGTGIGLALARGLARQHGGELALAARDGGGCVGTLRLPNQPPAKDDANGEQAA